MTILSRTFEADFTFDMKFTSLPNIFVRPQELLKSLAQDKKTPEQIEQIKSSINLSEIAAEAFSSLSTWRELMPSFETSAMLLQILEKVLDLVPKNLETSVRASQLSTEILSRRWPAAVGIKV